MSPRIPMFSLKKVEPATKLQKIRSPRATVSNVKAPGNRIITPKTSSDSFSSGDMPKAREESSLNRYARKAQGISYDPDLPIAPSGIDDINTKIPERPPIKNTSLSSNTLKPNEITPYGRRSYYEPTHL